MTIPELEERLLLKSYRPNADAIQAAVEAEPDRLLPYLFDRFTEGTTEGFSILSMSFGNIMRANPWWFQAEQQRLYRASTLNHHPGVRRNVLRYFSELPVLLEDEHPVPTWVKRKDFLYCRSSNVEQQKNGPHFVEPELEGYLLDHLTEVIANVQEVAAPKAFSMILGTNLALKYPEISNELEPIIRDAMKYGTPGVKNRGKAALNLLGRLSEDM